MLRFAILNRGFPGCISTIHFAQWKWKWRHHDTKQERSSMYVFTTRCIYLWCTWCKQSNRSERFCTHSRDLRMQFASHSSHLRTAVASLREIRNQNRHFTRAFTYYIKYMSCVS
jgi:hypothetical protein